MMRRIFSLTVLVCLLLAFALAALADDLSPPPWQRGTPRTTFQQWEFSTDASPAVLESGWNNIYGTPQLKVWPKAGGQWMPDYDTRYGVWPLSGFMEIVIPNAPDHPDWTKIIWLQLTWQQQVSTCIPFLLADGNIGPGYPGMVVEQDSVGGATGQWYHTTYEFTLPYNPKFETIWISGNVLVDEVVVDTACVPEPSSLLAAVITCSTGLIGFARKRIG